MKGFPVSCVQAAAALAADKLLHLLENHHFSSVLTVMQKAEKRLCVIQRKIKLSGISGEQLGRMEFFSKLTPNTDGASTKPKRFAGVALCTFVAILLYTYNNLHGEPECVLGMPVDSSKIFREPEDCNMCEGVTKIDKIKNISTTTFERDYALSTKPVVITDGTRGWSAVDKFTFEFFKELYSKMDDAKNECQFFPYKTEFKSLREALAMKPERARLESGEKPWYIGWSNCNDEAGKILRTHYDRPYFLPESSENIALNWIFMGGPGFGAHMHVDNVQYPSWQAQLRGKKLWHLAPPPECLYRCQDVEVVVEPGEVIVVDTNRWYHRTHILPGDISVTIGSEFD